MICRLQLFCEVDELLEIEDTTATEQIITKHMSVV